MDKKKLRKTILEENNTAQQKLEEKLSKKSKRITEISFSENEPLYGNINLGILSELGFNHVRLIIFAKGNITSITNIPEGLRNLHIADNLLEKIENLPDSLITLNVSSNAISEIDLSRLKLLKELNVSNNQLTELTYLPESLEKLYCSHNSIKKIDLESTRELKILHCDYNPRLKVYHLPDTLIDTKFPETMIQLQQETTSSTSRNIDEKEAYLESIRNYFLIKKTYEAKKLALAITHREKKRKGSPPLPLCFGCGVARGMHFSFSDEKYKAYCGGSKPCSWKIVIHRGFFVSHEKLLSVFMDDVEEYKENIIRQKMDTLFHYLTEHKSAELFEKQLTAYKKSSEQIHELLNQHNHMFFSETKKEAIQKKRLEIQETLQNVHQAIQEGDIEHAVHLQVHDILPKSQYIQRLMYEVMGITYDNTNTIVRLVQEEVDKNKLELNLGDIPSVEVFGKTSSSF